MQSVPSPTLLMNYSVGAIKSNSTLLNLCGVRKIEALLAQLAAFLLYIYSKKLVALVMEEKSAPMLEAQVNVTAKLPERNAGITATAINRYA